MESSGSAGVTKMSNESYKSMMRVMKNSGQSSDEPANEMIQEDDLYIHPDEKQLDCDYENILMNSIANIANKKKLTPNS